MRRIDHDPLRLRPVLAERHENRVEHTQPAPAHEAVIQRLVRTVYAGYLQLPRWGIPLKQAAHEPLIDFATYQRIQNRIAGAVYAPRRKNLNEDFPLRGFVLCDDCGETLTACWTKGRGKYHPYYHCFVSA